MNIFQLFFSQFSVEYAKLKVTFFLYKKNAVSAVNAIHYMSNTIPYHCLVNGFCETRFMFRFKKNGTQSIIEKKKSL